MMRTTLPSPLVPNAVHVWRIALNPDDGVVVRLGATLSSDEVERADRFRGPMLRRRFVVGRAAMRSILAGYLEAEPERITFAYGARGKPRLAGVDEWLEFNLSHTEDLALCAITRGKAVGIDIERLRPMDDAGQIMSRFFTSREQAEFFNHPQQEQPAAFFRAWTRKEALLKATGDGLASLGDTYEVPFAKVGPERMSLSDDTEAVPCWTLLDLDVGLEYLAALAVAGRLGEVLLNDWKPG
jgi:4'-phosphopantetheinyl transferase